MPASFHEDAVKMAFYRSILFLACAVQAAGPAHSDTCEAARSDLGGPSLASTADVVDRPKFYAFIHADAAPEAGAPPIVVRAGDPGDGSWRQAPARSCGEVADAGGMPRAAQISDRGAIADILWDIAARDGTVSILLTMDGDALHLDTRSGARTFRIPELRIERGVLIHRDPAGETRLGRIILADGPG